MLSKRLIGLVSAAALLSTTQGAMADTTLTMWTFLDPAKTGGRDVALKEMIDRFEQAEPGVSVRVEPQVWTTLAEKFVLSSNAGNAPDISWVNAENLGLILNTDAAGDLSPIVAGWSDERREDMTLPGALDAVTVDGEIRAMPLMAITWVLMYRADLFEQAGLDPAMLATWDGVTEAAKALTRDTSGDGRPDVWGIGLGLATERFSATPAPLRTIGALGGLFDPTDCRPAFAGPEAEAALTMQAEWITVHEVTPREALSMTSDDAIDQFAAGRYAMMIIANSRFEQIQRTAVGWEPSALAIAPIPGIEAGKPGPAVITGWYAVVSAKSPRIDAARAFVEQMAGPDGMALWNLPGGQVPMLHSVAARAEMAEPQHAHLGKVSRLFAETGSFMPGRCNWSRTLADFNLATQQVVLGQRSPAEALAEAERATWDRQ
jgi:multiple sugar transport system substrate-binding protein